MGTWEDLYEIFCDTTGQENRQDWVALGVCLPRTRTNAQAIKCTNRLGVCETQTLSERMIIRFSSKQHN